MLSLTALAPQVAQIKAIVKMSPPTNVSELRAFLGTTSYYRRYVRDYAQIVRPLHRLLQPLELPINGVRNSKKHLRRSNQNLALEISKKRTRRH
jgi:hypothetical protein